MVLELKSIWWLNGCPKHQLYKKTQKMKIRMIKTKIFILFIVSLKSKELILVVLNTLFLEILPLHRLTSLLALACLIFRSPSSLKETLDVLLTSGHTISSLLPTLSKLFFELLLLDAISMSSNSLQFSAAIICTSLDFNDCIMISFTISRTFTLLHIISLSTLLTSLRDCSRSDSLVENWKGVTFNKICCTSSLTVIDTSHYICLSHKRH